MQISAVDAVDLRKTYGQTEALRGVSFTAEAGRVTAILGPNGAGKTTCLRILSTSLMPTAGSARVLGCDLIREVRQIRRRIAVVPQGAFPDSMLTGWELVYGYLVARGIPRKVAAERAERYLRRLGLWDVRKRTTDTYSGGMRRRVMIGMALASEAPLIFLDEPSTGLDPEAKREVWELLHEVRGGTSLVLTTHLMDEVEALADWVVILSQGEIIAQGTVEDLCAQAPGREKLLCPRDIPREQLLPLGYVQEQGNRWALFPRDTTALHRAVDLVRGQGAAVSIQRASLEDGYLAVLNRCAVRTAGAVQEGI